MLIKKEFHFYAAHRNQKLTDKCFALHGHRYGVSIFYEAIRRDSNVTIPFSAFHVAEKYFLEKWDHAAIFDEADPILPYLAQFEKEDLNQSENGPKMKYVLLKRPSSVENVCFEIFYDMVQLGYPVAIVEVKETDSSTVVYSKEDFHHDLAFFKMDQPATDHECELVTNPFAFKCFICGKTRYEYRVEQRRRKSAAHGGEDIK